MHNPAYYTSSISTYQLKHEVHHHKTSKSQIHNLSHQNYQLTTTINKLDMQKLELASLTLAQHAQTAMGTPKCL